MKLNESVAIKEKDHIIQLSSLYGKMDVDELSRVINQHMKVVIEENLEGTL